MSDEFDIVAIFWEDHIRADRSPLPLNPDDLFDTPTLSVGILLKETEKSLVLVSDFERYSDRDEGTYMCILKSTIVAIKRYGKISIENIKLN